MARVVTIRVLSGVAQVWSYYYLYCRGDGVTVASPRSRSDLSWPMGRLHGAKDGAVVDFVGTVRTRDKPDRWATVYACGDILVADPGDLASGEPELLEVEVEGA